jgi:hypothetical protein
MENIFGDEIFLGKKKFLIPVFGDIWSKSLTMAEPCFSVHILIGDPPPI